MAVFESLDDFYYKFMHIELSKVSNSSSNEVYQSMGTLCVELLMEFCTNHFQTLQVF